MRIDFQLIFWLLVITFVVITTIKRIIREKRHDGDVSKGGNKIRNARSDGLRKVQRANNWETVLDNLLGGVEPGPVSTGTQKSQELSLSHDKEIVKPVLEKSRDCLDSKTNEHGHKENTHTESGIDKLKSNIEDRHLETEIEKHVFRSSFDQAETELTTPDFYGDVDSHYRGKKRAKNSILNKSLLKKAIVFFGNYRTSSFLSKKR